MKSSKKAPKADRGGFEPAERGMKVKIFAKSSEKRRIHRVVETDRSKRVMTPLEAEEKNSRIFSKLGMISNAERRQALRIRRLKARRTVALSPAPAPITARQSGASSLLKIVLKSLAAYCRKIDFFMLTATVLLGAIGVITVHSATLTVSAHRRIDILQIACFMLGIALIAVLSIIDYTEIVKRSKLLFFINIGLLLYTLIFGVGVTGESNKSWIDLYFTRIQPAEFSKLLFIITFSAHLEKVRDKINRIPVLFGLILHGGVVIGLVLAEKDWGNTLVFIAIFAAMLFAAKIDFRYIIGFIAAGIMAFPFVWDNLGEFRQKRVLVGFNPELDPQGTGHQVIISRNTIASGGFSGQGYMKGSVIQETEGISLFAKHTDMIFASIGQEFGFIGCAVTIIAFLVLVFRILNTAAKAGDYAGYFVCTGVAGMLIFQFVVNIGMTLGITPVVGITLPLVSYGASSLVSVYASLALVMSVYANSKNYSYRSV